MICKGFIALILVLEGVSVPEQAGLSVQNSSELSVKQIKHVT